LAEVDFDYLDETGIMKLGPVRGIPNYLTISRIALIPVFVILYQYGGAFWGALFSLLVFSIATFTDVLDGRIARETGKITDFGKVMDPIADKLLVAAALIVFLRSGPGLITIWMVLIIIVREAAVGGFRIWAAASGKVMGATKMGKYKAASQIFAIIISLLLLTICDARERFFSGTDRWNFLENVRHHDGPIYYLMYIPVLITLVSGLKFFYNNRNLLKEIVTA
jgi:CDP-diacylglycerol--glycerol-3-phosphate 3-phosphatidyltransferase